MTKEFKIIVITVTRKILLSFSFNLRINSKEKGMLKTNDFRAPAINNLLPEFEYTRVPLDSNCRQGIISGLM